MAQRYQRKTQRSRRKSATTFRGRILGQDGQSVQLTLPIAETVAGRHWKVVSAERLRQFLERPLGELDLLALLIDGIEFHDHLLMVALGLDEKRFRRVRGYREMPLLVAALRRPARASTAA